MDNNKKRETFSSGLAVFFATLSSAVGLGNIWKFPYLTGENGGGAFVFVYLISVLLLGIPIISGEFYIGRKSRTNAVGAFKKLNAHPLWKSIGYIGIVAVTCIVLFYSAVAGWVYSYVFKALTGSFSDLANKTTEEAIKITSLQFDNTVNSVMPPIIWQFIVLLVVSIILTAGVQKGIEKVTKTLMPLLFVLIIICDIRALTLPSALKGLSFLFSVDFSKINPSVILTALGLAFFKLGVGLGVMITYGSYFTKDNNLFATSTKVALSDTLVSLLAGAAIFPVVFQFGIEPGGGPGLLFKTIPLVFSKMPLGNLLLTGFFLLAAIASTTALLSMVESVVVFLCEEINFNRTKAVFLTTGVIFLIGALTVHPKSLFGSVMIMDKSLFDIFDELSSKVLLPLGGLLISIFIGYFTKKDSLIKEFSNEGTLNNSILIKIFYFVIRYITPVLILIVFLSSLGIIKM